MASSTEGGWRPLAKPVRAATRVTGIGPTPFSRLAVVHLISTAGDTLVTLALAGSLFFSISPTAARGRVALSLVLTMAPFAVVAPFLGPAIDRVRTGRRWMVAGSLAGRAVAAGAMAASLHSLLLFPAAFFVLVFSKMYAVSKSALVPAVVETDEELVRANSRLTVGAALMGIAAGLPGALVLKLLGARAELRLALFVFAVGTMLAFRIQQVRTEDTPAPAVDVQRVRTRGITLAAIVIAVMRAVVGFLTFLLAFELRRHHASALWFGVVLLASMGGGLAGAAIAPRLRGRVREETIVIGSLVAVVVAGLVAAYLGGRGAAAALAGVVGLANGAGKLAFDALVQRDSHDSMRGRAFARFEAIFQSAWVLGGLAPVLITMSDRTGAVVIAGASLATVAFYASARLRKESTEEPAPGPAPETTPALGP